MTKNVMYSKVFGFLCREYLLSEREQDNLREKHAVCIKNKKIRSLCMCPLKNQVNFLKQSFISSEPRVKILQNCRNWKSFLFGEWRYSTIAQQVYVY